MEFVDKRPMIEEEDKYVFAQSSELNQKSGLIGYLRADLDPDGCFFSSWNGFNDDRKTPEFKTEIDAVINELREEGDILHTRKSLVKYCYDNPQARISLTERECYGLRVDTENYAYLFRLSPVRGDMNVYCYCYIKQYLDDQILAEFTEMMEYQGDK